MVLYRKVSQSRLCFHKGDIDDCSHVRRADEEEKEVGHHHDQDEAREKDSQSGKGDPSAEKDTPAIETD